MPVLRFPDPRDADDDGLLALGGDLHPETLRMAYRQGIFPWPHDDLPLLWFSPAQRAILSFDQLHIPKSLSKEQRRGKFTFTIDRAFDQVIVHCRRTPRPDQEGTWITPEMVRAYVLLHRLGDAHSVEAWDEEGNLAGGLYGIDAGGVFAGESMFYRQPYASKLCLLYLFDHLRARGATWIDIQMMTNHFQALGAYEVDREKFLEMLAKEQARGLTLFDPVLPAAPVRPPIPPPPPTSS